MTPSPDLRELGAFVDGELDLQRQLQLETELAGDGVQRAEVERLRALRQTVRAHADYHPAPEALRARLQQALGQQARGVAPATPAVARRPFAWPAFATGIAAAVIVLVAAQWVLPRSREEGRIADDVVASHARAVVAQRLVDVASSDHHTVKPWLSARLDFSPPVDDAPGPGTTLVGGRVDYIAGRSVAALVLQHGAHTVDWFIWPGAVADSAPQFGEQRGFRLAHWARGGMVHWVVSDLGKDEFAALVRQVSAQAQ